MRELDLMLEAYLDRCWEHASANEQSAFESILDLEDPDLYRLLSGHASATDGDLSDVVDKIRNAAFR
jgi:succinate dehydrogenase flavin-adding protein (antitoxin of CptAB toxin-antitoxin module)